MPHNLNTKIRHFVSHATPEASDNPPSRQPQPIYGNGNIVAGGNVTTVYERGMPPTVASNPNMTACPACDTPMSVTANACLACGDDLANRRLVAWQEARQRRATSLMALIGIPALAAILIGNHFSMPYLAMAGAVGAVLVVFIARAK